MSASVRVGTRQWKVLLILADDPHLRRKVGELRRAIVTGAAHVQADDVVESLWRKGYVAHACDRDDHELTEHCTVRITDAGLGARLGKAGRRRLLTGA